MAASASLTASEIETRLDEYLETEFSFLKTEQPARVLAGLERPEQDFILSWVQRVASTNIQLAHQFINQAVSALDRLDRKVIEAWALHAMDSYDQRGLHPAMEVIRNVDGFVQGARDRESGCVLEDEAGVLLHFVHGLSGRQLKLEEADTAWTDTETLYLPPLIARLTSTADNFKLYKATVAYLWAQTRFGTFRVRLSEILQQIEPTEEFLALFQSLERLRLESCIARELPGLYRDMQRIKHELDEARLPGAWGKLAERFHHQVMSADDTLQLALDNLGNIDPLPAVSYQGTLDYERAEACMAARMEKERVRFKVHLAKLLEEIKQQKPEEQDPSQHKFAADYPDQQQHTGEITVDLTLDDMPVPLPDQVRNLMTSIIVDFGEIPDEYLEAAGPGEYDPSLLEDEKEDPDAVWQGTYHEEGAFLYSEWDCRRMHYRKNWCAVREKTITPVFDSFADDTLDKYHGLIKHLRKIFEAMRDEDRVLNRQPYGDGIDIDATVEALAASHDGSEMTDRLFTRLHRTERNIAVVFMVDMSGSTKGWINDAERESLILLCETLETLGDRYAIYGFSGMARKRCEMFKIKEFGEMYNDEIKARISGIRPQDYTRMGFAIRHLSHILSEVDAKTRILITISDGKPDDYDNYRGVYGIEDTRRALVEARRQGIHPYCITIDTEAKDYLPYMYGDAAYTVIDNVHQLPLKVSDIYRKLTS